MSELIVMDSIGEGQYNYHVATPAEISAAHPKCETCGHFMAGDNDRLKDVGACRRLNGSPYVYSRQYCSEHTEISK